MKIHLPDRHDALALIGGLVIIVGVWQVLPWLAVVVAGGFLLYIGIVTEAPEPPEKR